MQCGASEGEISLEDLLGLWEWKGGGCPLLDYCRVRTAGQGLLLGKGPSLLLRGPRCKAKVSEEPESLENGAGGC
jgi:hypothetical protein